MKLVPNFVVSTKSYFSLKRDCFWGDQFDIVQIFWIAWYEYIFAHLMGCKFFQQMTKPKVMDSLWGLSACGSYQEAQNAPFELYFRFKLHGKTWRHGIRVTPIRISRDRESASLFVQAFQLRRNLDCWNFAKTCESFLIILTFSFFIWICPCLVSRLVPVPFNIFVLLWRLRFFVNGWISVVKKLLPPDNTRGTKKCYYFKFTTDPRKGKKSWKIVFTE